MVKFHCIFRYSILLAIMLDGIIYSQIMHGSFNGETFKMWLEGLLEEMNPYLEPNSVLVVDNCTIHHVKGIQEMCDER
jgi:hypothetical protein